MIYQRYGECFRKLRTQKDLGMSHFEKVGIDRANLSRFERGLSMMNFERVDIMLQVMHVTLAEYELLLNNFVPDFLDIFLTEIENADFDFDFKKLDKLYQEAYGSGYPLLAIAVKSCFSIPSANELSKINEYLMKVEYWGYFEISLIYFTMEHFTIEDLVSLFNAFERISENYYGILKYRRRLLQIAFRIVIQLASLGEEKSARTILELTEKRKNIRVDIYIEIVHQLAVGTIIYFFEDKKRGKNKLEYNLNILEEFGDENLKNFYLNRLLFFLK